MWKVNSIAVTCKVTGIYDSPFVIQWIKPFSFLLLSIEFDKKLGLCSAAAFDYSP